MKDYTLDIKDKVAVVTGAGGVLCSMFSKTLAEQGAKVALLDLNGAAVEQVAKEIQEEGYIAGYEVIPGEPRATLEITLKYGEKKAKTIRGIKRISKPGLRIYSTVDKLPRVLGGLGTAVISTSKGMMCDRDARKLGVGGEVIAYVW